MTNLLFTVAGDESSLRKKQPDQVDGDNAARLPRRGHTLGLRDAKRLLSDPRVCACDCAGSWGG